MPELAARVQIFDPATPFLLVPVDMPNLDTWHERCLITRKLRAKLPHVPDLRLTPLLLSGGMYVEAPLIEIGIQIGSVKLENVETVVVDSGHHPLLLGANAVELTFAMGNATTKDTDRDGASAKVTSPLKESVDALSIQLYPVGDKLELRALERMFAAIRHLYNVLLYASRTLPLPASPVEAVDNEREIPSGMRLTLSWIESGSIWATFRSGSLATLRYLAGLFETSATAKLAQEMAEADNAESRSHISRETRDATVARMVAEQERLRHENLWASHAAWRKEVADRLAFADELIAQLGNAAAAAELRQAKDAAIVQLVQQDLLPIVRNVPRHDSHLRMLPPPS